MPVRPTPVESRHSRRVRFPGGNGFDLAGIVDLPSAGPHEFVGDGDTLREEASADVGPLQQSPVIVFSHCFTCNKDLKAIVRLGRALAGEGIAVLRYDMTGLGGSDGDFSRTNFTTNLADLRAAIHFATGELGPVTGLLGHSFGGAASLAVAGDASGLPQSLRAIAALAAPSDTQHLAALMAKMNPAIQNDGAGEVEIGGRRWMIRREMLDDFRSHHLDQWISKISLPLMLLHSPVDRTVGFDHALRIMQLASGRRDGAPPTAVSLVALDGADHLLAKNPDDLSYVAGLLASFYWRHR
ncbi:MAG TPA: alpha/beta hydrolase [Planctomycetaceae bacterium]|nr:alpha/beta hydrolase [Planctomycetaceae bacterium]